MPKNIEQSQDTGKKNSVEKTLTILMSFVPQNKLLGSSEISKLTGMSTSTVNRLLHILLDYDFVKQDPINKKFSLGKAAFELGSTINDSLPVDLINIARPYCDRLRDEVGETVGLEVWAGESAFQAYNAPSHNPISVLNTLRRIGERYPLHVASGTKAILAFLPSQIVDHLIKDQLQRFTPNTITDPDKFKIHLNEVRKNGIAIDNGEFNIETYAIGAPIFDVYQKPIAALVIAAPFYRATILQQPSTIASLKKTVSDISSQLFYSSTAPAE